MTTFNKSYVVSLRKRTTSSQIYLTLSDWSVKSRRHRPILTWGKKRKKNNTVDAVMLGMLHDVKYDRGGEGRRGVTRKFHPAMIPPTPLTVQTLNALIKMGHPYFVVNLSKLAAFDDS